MVVGFGLLAVSAVLLVAGAELFTENTGPQRAGWGSLFSARRSCWPARSRRR